MVFSSPSGIEATTSSNCVMMPVRHFFHITESLNIQISPTLLPASNCEMNELATTVDSTVTDLPGCVVMNASAMSYANSTPNPKLDTIILIESGDFGSYFGCSRPVGAHAASGAAIANANSAQTILRNIPFIDTSYKNF